MKQFLLKATTSTAYKAACSAENCNPGDKEVDLNFSNVVQMDMTVCGNEKIEAKSTDAEEYTLIKHDSD